ncbi:hypothetical protein IEQ34_008771 [Dendrobium chrysotoxum]|uniref:Uncharacterized protein n=1 Tax=Dendrobium chrysotoxum TaxID=161865 RepID=A0AAV7GYN3_DENCH|nr:hypothetical protein IEQ34_008771 [Dendrobium chrysotoxum]
MPLLPLMLQPRLLLHLIKNCRILFAGGRSCCPTPTFLLFLKPTAILLAEVFDNSILVKYFIDLKLSNLIFSRADFI